jgi:NADH dehydrogenase
MTILVTGGTGFIGRALIRHLVDERKQVRVLIRPNTTSPNLPRGVPIDVAISNISDERSLQAALVGVKSVYHLVGGEWYGSGANLHDIEIEGTRMLVDLARDTGVERIFYASHLGSDRASAYAVLKAKGIAEEYIRRSGIDFTIFRSGLVYGPRDNFTTALARLFYFFPLFFPVPGDGNGLVQPLWVQDLVTCMAWALEDTRTRNQIYEVGGPEHLSINQVVLEVMRAVGVKRRLVQLRPSYLRIAGVILEYAFPGLPLSIYWLDYMASSRTCALDTIPRVFGLMPARFSNQLHHLKGENWRIELLRNLFRRN